MLLPPVEGKCSVDDYLLDEIIAGDKYKELNRLCNEGEKTPSEFFREKRDLLSTEYLDLYLLYQTELSDLEIKYEIGTPWIFWKRFFIIFEMILIVLNLLGYVFLYKKKVSHSS